MRIKYLVTLVIFALFVSIAAYAASYTLYNPADVGSTGIATTEQAYVGNGSWKNNGAKFNLNFDATALFGRTVGLTEVASISYNTYKSAAQNGLNFYVNIYTNPDGVNDDASWYGRRLTFEPLYAYNFNDIVGAWNTFSTNAGTNQLTVYDGLRTNLGFYNGPTLQTVQSGAINWGSYPTSGSTQIIDYTGETLKFIVVDTGNPWAASFQGYVDNIVITLTSGESAVINLDAPVGPPTSKEQCKDNGWMIFNNPVFMNQGECVSFVNN